jgi:hypothetical protein
MALDEHLPDGPSRRALLRTAGAGIAAGSSLLLAGCGGAAKPRRKLVAGSDPVAVRDEDIAVLNEVLDLENEAIASYEAGIQLLSGHARAAAAQFLGQELAHATKLESTIRAAGAKPHPPRSSYPLGNPSDEAAVLRQLSTTEASLVNAYLLAIPKLTPGWLRAVAAGILANESQHVSVLRMLRGRPPVPGAFVTAAE